MFGETRGPTRAWNTREARELSFLKEPATLPNMRPRSYRRFGVLNCSLDYFDIDENRRDVEETALRQARNVLLTEYILRLMINAIEHVTTNPL